MRRLTPEKEAELLRLIEIMKNAGEIAAEAQLPLNTVIHYQRLYGSFHLQMQRADEDRKRIAEMRRENMQAAREAQMRPRGHRGHRIIAALDAQRRERWLK